LHEAELSAISPAGSRRTLAIFSPPVFGSFLVISPDRRDVIFGESTTGAIHAVPLQPEGGEPRVVDNVSFNFDLAFDRQGRGFISAPGASAGENAILLFDRDAARANPLVVRAIPGFSGPVAFDGQGDLHYVTAVFDRPPVLVRFRRAQLDAALASGQPLEFADGETLPAALEGAYDLAVVDGRIVISDLGFGPSGLPKVLAFDPSDGYAPTTLAALATTPSQTLVRPTFLAFAPAAGAFFQCGAGRRSGGALAFSYGDFSTIAALGVLNPTLRYQRGRVNADDAVTLVDAIAVLRIIFLGDPAPVPIEAADINGDEEIDIGDAIYLLRFIFLGGQAPPPPFEEPGPDPAP
jgi:hypothetical protein